MTKSRPALSVKRKQAALRSKSKSAAGKGNDTTCENCKPFARAAKEFSDKYFEVKRKLDGLVTVELNLDGKITDRISLPPHEMSSELASRLGSSQRNVKELQTRLTAAQAEAEGLREKIERDTQRTIAENDRHEKQYVQKFREWEALVEMEAKLGAEIEALHADQLLQANTLKALREELKVAQHNSRDWALNHEKEKRRADGLDIRPSWLEVFLIAGLVALGMSFAGYWHGKIGADRWHASHPVLFPDEWRMNCISLNGEAYTINPNYENPACWSGATPRSLFITPDHGNCRYEIDMGKGSSLVPTIGPCPKDYAAETWDGTIALHLNTQQEIDEVHP